MAKKITLEQLYKKVEGVEKMVKEIMKKEMSELRLLGEEISDNARVFDDVTEWKLAIWDVCEFRIKKADLKGTYYKCKKTGGYCNFSSCPKNLA